MMYHIGNMLNAGILNDPGLFRKQLIYFEFLY